MRTPVPPAVDTSESPLIADDIALDFLNTRYGVGAERRECLRSDDDVLAWAHRAGLTAGNAAPSGGKPGALLKVALELRESGRRLIQQRKLGEVGNASLLNRILALDTSYEQLTWGKTSSPTLIRHRVIASPEALLVPVAAAFARLIVHGDFSMVRECESADCTLWFYDRTKSHKRRWCSMALCGNRAKVAAFRDRHRPTASARLSRRSGIPPG
jgi:predicted RNA-binding Zn ribbon-like protein